MAAVSGRIHSVESFGTLDGPGVRYVVFLQGCPLRCLYCHNPDTWAAGGGTETTVPELMRRIESCRNFIRSGGVTLSGGRLPSGETDETLTAAQKAVDAAQAAQDEAQKKFNSANRLGISENVINYITQSRQLNEKLATTQEKITALDVMAQQARQVTAPHDGYIVEINVKAGDSYDGKTAALVISSESGDAVLRADTSKIEKKIDKGTQVTVKRDSDKTLTKKVTDSGVNEEGKRYIDVKLTDKDITNLGGGAALFSAAVEMTASYRASSSTTLLPASAVRGSGDSRYVYIVSEESNALGQRVLKVKKQDVKVLSEVGSTVSIQDDLSRQRVAYMEDRAISDGSEVMVYGE